MCDTMPIFLGGISKVPIPTGVVVGAEQVGAFITEVSLGHGCAGKIILLIAVWMAIF